MKSPIQKYPKSLSRLVRRSLCTVLAALVLPLAFSATLSAEQPISLAEAAQRGQTLHEQYASTGIVLVVVRRGEVLIKGYGETAPGSGVAPGADSVVRLCSISKVFTTDLLLRLSASGKLHVDDPLSLYAPQGKTVPAFNGKSPITLLDLATHTSGLPREVSSYPPRTPHFTFPDRNFRWNWLPHQKLLYAPGTRAVYSNIGFDLLGDALSTASGMSYAHLLHDRLLQPLAMWDTTLVPSPAQCARLLRSNRNEGPCTDTQPSGPSGGLYSTGADMAKFLNYQLHLPGAPAQPEAALDPVFTPSRLTSMYGLSHAGKPTGIGYAWVEVGDPATPSAIIQKTGGGAGFATYIALNRARQTGIFLAVTEGKGHTEVELFSEGNKLLAALAGVPPIPPAVRPVRASARHGKTNLRNQTQRPANSRSAKGRSANSATNNSTSKSRSAKSRASNNNSTSKSAAKSRSLKNRSAKTHPANRPPTKKKRAR